MIARLLSSILSNWRIALAVAVLLIGTHALAYCTGRNDGRSSERIRTEQAARKTVEQAREADEITNTRRQADDERNDDAARERKEAAATGGRAAVNCERLRRAYPDRPLPAGC